MRLRKQRQWSDLASDPQTPYMIGRILGAHEMAVVLLSETDNDTAKHVAGVLERVGAYFMEERLEMKQAIVPQRHSE
jgi:hypothetical protein